MTSHPILFNDAMVRAILAGRKTQTRRLNGCEKWQPGDTLWVREAFCIENTGDYHGDHDVPTDGRPIQVSDDVECGAYWRIPHYRATDPDPHIVPYRCDADDDRTRWRPSIHMPRWASRISLTITDVRRERLNAISGMDAVREGISPPAHLPHDGADLDYARREFMRLWDSIYCEGAWAGNPLVWVVSFKLADGTA
jgi:hypothetical protein